MPTPWLPGAGSEGGGAPLGVQKGRSGVCTARTEAPLAAPRHWVCGGAAMARYELPRAGNEQGEAERLNLSLQLLWKGSDERCSDGGPRLSFHVHSCVCGYYLPQVKPLALSLPLTPNEVRLVGRTNVIYEIAGCNSRGKGEY